PKRRKTRPERWSGCAPCASLLRTTRRWVPPSSERSSDPPGFSKPTCRSWTASSKRSLREREPERAGKEFRQLPHLGTVEPHRASDAVRCRDQGEPTRRDLRLHGRSSEHRRGGSDRHRYPD